MMAEITPHVGRLALHRHAEPEIYVIAAGTGILTVEGVERSGAAGTAVFIRGDAEHGIGDEATGPLRFFYVFPTDRFSDAVTGSPRDQGGTRRGGRASLVREGAHCAFR